MSVGSAPTSQRAINAPAVVLALIVCFVAIHLYRVSAPAAQDMRLIMSFAFIPARFAYPADVTNALFGGGAAMDALTFVSYMFLHADWLHLAVNSLWMLAFGSVLARRFGVVRFVVFSLICAAAGAGLHLFLYWKEVVPMIGASAAISGQMAGAVRFIFARPSNLLQASRMQPQHMRAESLIEVARNPRALIFLSVWIGVNIFFGLNSSAVPGVGEQVAWEAHLGGFLAGLLLFGIFDRGRT